MVRAQQGDEEAYRQLLTDIRGSLLGMLRRYASTPDQLEDLVQDVLLSVHRARRTYDPSRPFEPWLFAVARYEAWAAVKRRLRRESQEILEEDVSVHPGDDSVSLPQLDAVLRRLPPKQREAVRLLKVEGLSLEEAAARSGTTVGALKVRAHRAYRALKDLLRP
jgi:RNA polymerase sigma-70 factor (ECF subfamily)